MAFENNVQATLQANVAIGATTVDVVKAVAPNKDVPASGRLTLSATGKTEIISYTGRTDNTTYWTLTGVTKNAESSFGDQAWSAGDACFQALTAADVASLSTIHSATAPTNPTVGTKWFNTTTGVLQEYLTDGTDFAWLDISAGATVGAPAGLSATVIAPAAQGYINSENSGTAAGCSYTYNAGTTTVTFNTAMADINYSVITDKEGFDEHQVLTGNKSLTSFSMLSRDSAGTNVMSPASWPYSFVVYASDPVQNVLANKGDTGAAGPAGSSTLSGLSDTTVSTTNPLITTNPPAVGHVWVNSTIGQVYICSDITTDNNIWVNVGNGAQNIFLNIVGQTAYTTAGTYSWTAPAGVASVCVVAVGSGASGNRQAAGGNGEDSYFISALTVMGPGGNSTTGSGSFVSADYVGDGGGKGGESTGTACSGGGAGGYSGNGGNVRTYNESGLAGTGGAGGSGGMAASASGSIGGGGGGVGILGEGASGSAGGVGLGGGGGSGGTAGADKVGSNNAGEGGVYGGGGGSGYGIGFGGGGGGLGWKNNISVVPGQSYTVQVGAVNGTSVALVGHGGKGAVRIIWGQNRAFPSTDTGDL